MAGLMYGTGMRLMECVRLRVGDVDFGGKAIAVRQGKGGKDRILPLPARYGAQLEAHLLEVEVQHKEDLAAGLGSVFLPNALAAQVSECPAGVDMAVCVSKRPLVAGPQVGTGATAPFARVIPAAQDQGSGDGGEDPKEGVQSCLAPFLRHPFARSGLRYPHGARTAGACGCVPDHGVHARVESAWCGTCEESGGFLETSLAAGSGRRIKAIFCQMTYQSACLFVRLLCCASRYIARYAPAGAP